MTDTVFLALGLSFLLLWMFKQRHKVTQKIYLIAGIVLIVTYLVIRFGNF